MGTSLWAIHEHASIKKMDPLEHEVLIRRLADGICSDWREEYFFGN